MNSPRKGYAMYSIKPPKNTQAAIAVSSFLLAASMTVLAVGIIKRESFFFLQYFSLIPFCLSFMIFHRFAITEYEYTVDSGEFSITEKNTKRKLTVVRIPISEIKEITSSKKRKLPKGFSKNCRIYDYRQNMFPKRYSAIKTDSRSYLVNGKPIVILFESNEKMLHMLEE